MSGVRNQPKGARFALFGLGLCLFALAPTEVGYQDIASLLARQPGVGERWQKRMFSAASTIQVATYSFGRPIGTSSPQAALYRLASLETPSLDVTGSLNRNSVLQPPPRYQASDFPTVDRTLKGDRLVAPPSPEATKAATPTPDDHAPALEDPATSNASVRGAKTTEAIPTDVKPADATPAEAAPAAEHPPLDPELQAALNAPPLDDAKDASDIAAASPEAAPTHDGFSVQTAGLFFGSGSLGAPAESMESWQPGEAPTVVSAVDPDMKMASLSPSADPAKAGESIAAKGEVNADNQRAKTPAERLGLLDAKARAKSEKCLAEAVYFEARGEAVRGQIAVAQVVMNRVFSGFYPTTVCAVVYQNKYHHMACQFTFACDNVADVVREPDMWDRAKKIAKAMLDGQLWLPEVAKSTHYHAYWVHPSWVAEMKKMYKTGVHTFYRPRAWGDGSDAPSWGSKAQTAEISAELTEAAKSSAELSPNSVRR
jgi:spore germination cell wall hydrolase CwlJ-like protein